MPTTKTCWKSFQGWLQTQPAGVVSKGLILSFLHFLSHTKSLNPKTILVYRNTLHLPLLHGFNINTQDDEFSLLARAQFLRNSPRQRILSTWKPNKVLSMLEQPQFWTLTANSKNLLMKALFLTALATGNRVSELAALSRASMLVSPTRSQITLPVFPGFLYKNQSISRTPPNIVVKALCEGSSHHRLYPVDALLHWIELTKDWGSDSVFISPISKKAINRGAISHLLVRTINLASPNTFAKGHDVCKVSASLSWAREVPPEELIRNMFWSSSNILIKKYLIPANNVL